MFPKKFKFQIYFFRDEINGGGASVSENVNLGKQAPNASRNNPPGNLNSNSKPGNSSGNTRPGTGKPIYSKPSGIIPSVSVKKFVASKFEKVQNEAQNISSNANLTTKISADISTSEVENIIQAVGGKNGLGNIPLTLDKAIEKQALQNPKLAEQNQNSLKVVVLESTFEMVEKPDSNYSGYDDGPEKNAHGIIDDFSKSLESSLKSPNIELTEESLNNEIAKLTQEKFNLDLKLGATDGGLLNILNIIKNKFKQTKYFPNITAVKDKQKEDKKNKKSVTAENSGIIPEDANVVSSAILQKKDVVQNLEQRIDKKIEEKVEKTKSQTNEAETPQPIKPQEKEATESYEEGSNETTSFIPKVPVLDALENEPSSESFEPNNTSSTNFSSIPNDESNQAEQPIDSSFVGQTPAQDTTEEGSNVSLGIDIGTQTSQPKPALETIAKLEIDLPVQQTPQESSSLPTNILEGTGGIGLGVAASGLAGVTSNGGSAPVSTPQTKLEDNKIPNEGNIQENNQEINLTKKSSSVSTETSSSTEIELPENNQETNLQEAPSIEIAEVVNNQPIEESISLINTRQNLMPAMGGIGENTQPQNQQTQTPPGSAVSINSPSTPSEIPASEGNEINVNPNLSKPKDSDLGIDSEALSKELAELKEEKPGDEEDFAKSLKTTKPNTEKTPEQLAKEAEKQLNNEIPTLVQSAQEDEENKKNEEKKAYKKLLKNTPLNILSDKDVPIRFNDESGNKGLRWTNIDGQRVFLPATSALSKQGEIKKGVKPGFTGLSDLPDNDLSYIRDLNSRKALDLDDKSQKNLDESDLNSFDSKLADNPADKERLDQKAVENADKGLNKAKQATSRQGLANAAQKELTKRAKNQVIKKLLIKAAPYIAGALLVVFLFAGFVVLLTTIVCVISDKLPGVNIPACKAAFGNNDSCPAGYDTYAPDGKGGWVKSASGTPGDGSVDTGIGVGEIKCLAAPRSGDLADPYLRAFMRGLGQAENGGSYEVSSGCVGKYQFCSGGIYANVRGKSDGLGGTFPDDPTKMTPAQQDRAFVVAWNADTDFRSPGFNIFSLKSILQSQGIDAALDRANQGTAATAGGVTRYGMCGTWTPLCSSSVDPVQGKQALIKEVYNKVLEEEKSGKCGAGSTDSPKVALNQNIKFNPLAFFKGVEVSAQTADPNASIKQELISRVKSGKIFATFSTSPSEIESDINKYNPNLIKFILFLSDKYPGLQVNDMYRPGDAGYHGSGQAVDIGGWVSGKGNGPEDYSTIETADFIKAAQSTGIVISTGVPGSILSNISGAGVSGIFADNPGHVHFGVLRSDEKEFNGSGTTTQGTTTGSGNGSVCCPPGETPGGTSNVGVATVDKSQLADPAVKELLKSPKIAMIHYTASSASGADLAKSFKQLAESPAGSTGDSGWAHYIIDKDGTNYQIIDEKYKVSGVATEYSGLFQGSQRITDPVIANTNGVNYHAVQYEVNYNPSGSLNPAETITDAQLKSLSALIVSSGFGPDQVYTHWAVQPESRHDADDWIRIDGTVTASLKKFIIYAGWAVDDTSADKVAKKILLNNVENALKVYGDSNIKNGGETTPKSMLQSAKAKLISSTSFKIETNPNFLNKLAKIFSPIETFAFGTKPGSYSDLSAGHKAFLKEIATAKGYIEQKDGGSLKSETQKAFDDLAKASPTPITIDSGYRSNDSQVGTFFNNGNITDFWYEGISSSELAKVRTQYLQRATESAPPGFSEHLSGYGIDIQKPGEKNYTASSFPADLASWLETNSSKYGFKLSYPKESTTGAGYEPWHFLFVGNTTYPKSEPTPGETPGTTTGGQTFTNQKCFAAGSGSTNATGVTGVGSATLLEEAKKYAVGKPALGNCFTKVADYIDAVGFGKLGAGGTLVGPAMTADGWDTIPAKNFAYFLNSKGNATKYGLVNLLDANPNMSPYDAPAGAVVVVSPQSPGTRDPDAGDISVAGGGGTFYNDGEMGYGGASAWKGSKGVGGGQVLGIYVPI